MSGQVLDDSNIIAQRDPDGALAIIANAYQQMAWQPQIINPHETVPEITQVVITGMGGSALAALLVERWLKIDIMIPFQIVRSYSLPASVGPKTLVIVSSYSGNTEETVAALQQATQRGAQVAIVAAGGKLIEAAQQDSIPHVALPAHIQPRMALIDNLQAVLTLLEHYGIISGKSEEVRQLADWMKDESQAWLPDRPTAQNYAKQLASQAVGKNAVFYGGELTAPLAYKWKISWNESGKNVAWWGEYSEFNHNEFIGWTAQPVEKPYIVFDLISPLEHPQILKRFAISDRLLSGKRPKSVVIDLKGESVIAQLLWGCILADFASIYLAILNNVNPVPVELVERLKKELV